MSLRRLISRIKVPHVFVLLTGVILFCSLLTWIIPSGEYQRVEKTVGNLTRTVVVPGTFEEIPKSYSLKGIVLPDNAEGVASPTSLLDFLASIPRGMESAADIIFFIFVIGGVFGILQRSGMIHAILAALIRKFEKSSWLLTIILMTVIAIGGSTLGMGEEFIPLIPLFLLVSREMGYDRIYGLAIVVIAMEVGFASATTNPFTVQIAQGIAEVPLGSGLGLRLIFLACVLVVSIAYVLWYGARIKKDPTKSVLYGVELEEPIGITDEAPALRPRHLVIAALTAVIFGLVIYAVQTQGWWLAEMGGGFLLIGIFASIIGKLSVKDSVEAFVKGMEEMVVAAMVVGFAKGIQVVLDDAMVLDTIIHYASQFLLNFHRIIGAEGMLLFQTLLNFFIPSGSGQAAVTMPLMAPLADVLEIKRQVAVFAFTCGDGFSNMIIPTSGILMAMLTLAKVPYEKWFKFVWPIFLMMMALSAIFIVIAVVTGYQ